ncbi:MAG: xanthine dehydrogenase family protein molybdopterin-binding subunit [Deltaproteobacteria bacterium]|nr:xanthine dehydrogenase family protein molybdopterin-binding subunit [Deltaproteobacteria bacterium]
MKTSISRREFLKGSLAATGLTIAVSVTPFGYKLLNASMKKGDMSGFKPDVWFQITPDNLVTIWLPSSEMGQGARTALPMIVADELEADWGQVRIIQAPAADEFKNPILRNQLTVASAACRGYYEPLRKAGAAGRAMLIKAAASMWKVPESECEAFKGTIRHRRLVKSATYGQLCMRAAKLRVPRDPLLKRRTQFRYIGKPMPRVDIPEKVQGTAVFGQDVDLPDMLYAVLARPPAYGAKPISFDQKAAESIRGVKKVVPTPRGLVVCAESIDAALKGRDALNVTWSKGSHPDMDTEAVEASLKGDLDKPGAKVTSRGEVNRAISQAHKKHQAIYYVPAVAHATMEPMNCTAHVQTDRCDVWAPTQGQTVSQMVASKLSGLPTSKVFIHTTYLGCGLGRRAQPDFVIEAVLASKAIGKPVKVIWTREEDIKYDFFRAAAAHRIEAGIDRRGKVTAWSHKLSSVSILKSIRPQALKKGIDGYVLWGLYDSPRSPAKSNITYNFPNFYVELVLSELPVPAAPWRSVQNAPNAFVIESFVDELAHLAGKDPLEFRIQNLRDNRRARRVLETVAEKAGWGKPIPPGQGRGIAQHSCFGTYVAHVADVSVNQNTGQIKVHRIVVAVDCGQAVNPDALIAQIEGAVTLALSTTLKEEVQFADGGVASENFEDYDILRMSETPDIEVHIVDSKDEIGGIGEPGVPPTAPAVANAVFNATGVRFRRIPLTPGRVLAGLRGENV